MLENLEDKLKEVAEKLYDEVQMNLRAKGKVNTGALSDSIDVQVVEEDNNYILQYTMLNYGYYQDEGVRGKNPAMIKNGYQKAPLSRFKFGSGSSGSGSLRDGIDKWVRSKKIVFRNRVGKIMPHNSTVFLISRSIYFTGLEPSMFFTDSWEKMVEEAKPEIQDVLIKDLKKLVIDSI